jgi:hypothetical protein
MAQNIENSVKSCTNLGDRKIFLDQSLATPGSKKKKKKYAKCVQKVIVNLCKNSPSNV